MLTPRRPTQVGHGKDHTLYALEPGFVKFYSSPLPFPHIAPANASPASTPAAIKASPAVKRPRESRQYIGIVARREDRLPRDLLAEGRERRMWKMEAGQDQGKTLGDLIRDMQRVQVDAAASQA